MKLIRCRFEWKLQDMWVGVFWKHGKCITGTGTRLLYTDVWVCLLPCVPLHLTILKSVIPFNSKENP